MPFRNKEEELLKIGIQIKNDDGSFRNTYEVLYDLSNAWKKFDKFQEEYYANVLLKLF